MTKHFESIDYFSATSDIWSRFNQSFIAVSVHYFEPISLELKTSFIACERFYGSHTHDKVAEKLHSIFDRFSILKKVFFITTDGAGEYVAALKKFGDNYKSIQSLSKQSDIDWFHENVNDDSTDAGIDTANEHDIEILDSDNDFEDFDYDSIVRNECENNSIASETESDDRFIVHDLFDNIQSIPMLKNMNRVSCSSHKLDKVGKIDAIKAKEDADYAALYDNVFKTLKEIWAQKESRLKAEIFFRITGRKLIGPHRIRWLKTHDAVINLLTFNRNSSNKFSHLYLIFHFP